MNASAHQVADRFMDQAVTLDRIVPGEGGGDYGDFVMATVFGAGMAGMPMRFIFNCERERFKYRQALTQQLDCFDAHAGSAFLKGLTVTFA